jgi:chemotaxis protein methyltransferase CheR
MMVTPWSRTRSAHVDLTPFKQLLLRTCGHAFEKHREPALLEALGRRMAARALEIPEAYLSLLVHDQLEQMRLIELLTVNETYFFREPDHLNLMVGTLLPELLAAGNRRPVRILSAGCSTGEEPYSIAIMLRERFGAGSEQQFAITGVDIDSTVIAAAKQGEYGKSSLRILEDSLLERYFEPRAAGRFRIRDDIRNRVVFEAVNLLDATYPQAMLLPDIILYRNVSIYFPEQVQKNIFRRLAEILADGGCLLVGVSETMHHDIGILSLLMQDSLFYYRKTAQPVSVKKSRPALPSVQAQERSTRPVAVHGDRSATLRTPADPATGCRPPLIQATVKNRFEEALELATAMCHDKALAMVDAILEQDDSFGEAYCLKGSLLLSLARFTEARIVCDGILSRDPLCLDAYLMLGIIARQQGDNDGAFKRFREAIYLDASCWLAHFYSAEILFAQQDGKRAKNSYEATIRILEKGYNRRQRQEFFPLSFNAEQFMVVCRHKLSLLVSAKSIVQ